MNGHINAAGFLKEAILDLLWDSNKVCIAFVSIFGALG